MNNTKEIKIGNKRIGAGNKILVQSMLNVISTDVEGNVEQAKRLEAVGCDIVRVSVPDMEAVRLVEIFPLLPIFILTIKLLWLVPMQVLIR